MPTYRFTMMTRANFLMLFLLHLIKAEPRFDQSALLQEVLIPADAAVESIIYRLRSSDPSFSYPLIFSLQSDQPIATTVVGIDTLNCTRLNSICQANVILKKKLEPNRFYDFTVIAESKSGQKASLYCSFRATNATTPIATIFPGAPTLLMVSENSRRNTEIGIIIAKGNPDRPDGVLLELWGSPSFGLHQKLINKRDAQGTIILLGPLDFELQTVHHVTVLANDPWSELEYDTRNIASWPLLVAVLDEQDTPPIFTLAPPTTTLSSSLQPGDSILTVHAEDGDRGQPRDIRYDLVPDNNPQTRLFRINEHSGDLQLVGSMTELRALGNQPIILTVIAEEVRNDPKEPPAQSSTVRLALIPPNDSTSSKTPIFGATEYNVLLDENAGVGTLLNLSQAKIMGEPGQIISLGLFDDNGTFEISPGVVEMGTGSSASFQVRVHDPRLLDYELWKSVQCYVVAKEVSAGYHNAENSTTARLIAVLNDVNDNEPKFTENNYEASIPENAGAGSTVVRIEAFDRDRHDKITYLGLEGDGAEYFTLNSITGVITLTGDLLDAERLSVLNLFASATDDNDISKGHLVKTRITILVVDINDEIPQFEKDVYEFILSHDKTSFTTRALLKATDRDISPPNNEVHYEIINNPSSQLIGIDEYSGELSIRGEWSQTEVVVFKVRAWDGGIPRLASECEVRIYPSESQSRHVVFIVPGLNPDIEALKRTLSTVTGGRATIDSVRQFTGDKNRVATEEERSIVTATINYPKGVVVDINQIQEILERQYSQTQTTIKTKKDENATIVAKGGQGNLTWLFIILILLALIVAIILLLCCICQGCPLYVPPKRHRHVRKVTPVEQERFVRQDIRNKSVQASSEWRPERKLWTPEHVMMDIESLRRHEMERGSDRSEPNRQRGIHRQSNVVQMDENNTRDQFYIRDGNVDILRLVTRAGEQGPVTLIGADPNHPLLMTESGKDILMKRFIDQQHADLGKSNISLPNALNKLQTEHEMLEASFKQQNALLRQILIDRERDLKLETQSLPAGTQTDQDAGTQTEPLMYLRPPRRKVRSDNDDDDDDDTYYFVKRKTKRLHMKTGRKIKTPIQEEESDFEPYHNNNDKINEVKVKQTRTSDLRQKKLKTSRPNSNFIEKEVLREISASLKYSNGDSEDNEDRKLDAFSDSLEEDEESFAVTLNKNQSKSRNKQFPPYSTKSETDLRSNPLTDNKALKSAIPAKRISTSHLNLAAHPKQLPKDTQNDTKQSKSINPTNIKKAKPSRYMEWYNKKKDDLSAAAVLKKKKGGPGDNPESIRIQEEKPQEKKVGSNLNQRSKADKQQSAHRESKDSRGAVNGGGGPDHPLLQHSEHRFEGHYPITRRPEEDADSGIVLSKPPIAEKKSVFTIAYNDMHINQLRQDSTTP